MCVRRTSAYKRRITSYNVCYTKLLRTFLATKEFSEDKITVVEGSIVIPVIYKDVALNGTDPELETGMIPVVISDDGTVTRNNFV